MPQYDTRKFAGDRLSFEVIPRTCSVCILTQGDTTPKPEDGLSKETISIFGSRTYLQPKLLHHGAMGFITSFQACPLLNSESLAPAVDIGSCSGRQLLLPARMDARTGQYSILCLSFSFCALLLTLHWHALSGCPSQLQLSTLSSFFCASCLFVSLLRAAPKQS